MEGRELLKLLDFVGDLREEGNTFEEDAEQADKESKIANLKATAKAFKDIAEKLEKLLRELNA